MSDSRILSVKPIIHYPRVAQVGKTYLMTIDLEVEEESEWQYDEEEYPVYCTVESELFSSKPVSEPFIVLHRFGGSYGEARFLLTAVAEERYGNLKVALTNAWGVSIKTINLEQVQLLLKEMPHPITDIEIGAKTVDPLLTTSKKPIAKSEKMKEEPETSPISVGFALIITSLSVEYCAVRDHLTDLREEVHPLGTVYERGQFTDLGRSWKVGIIQIGLGVEAALNAERAISYFKPDIILSVGLAGGLKDVALGDVVVGSKIYRYTSSKEQQLLIPNFPTEISKSDKQQGSDEIKATFYPQPIVRSLAPKLEQLARLESAKGEWFNRCNSKSETRQQESTKNNIRSPESLSESELFNSDNLVSELNDLEQVTSGLSINQSRRDKIEALIEQNSEETVEKDSNSSRPRVFIAPIAVGDKVIALTQFEVFQFLREHYRDAAIAIEIGGLSLLAALQVNPNITSIVVRGISDLIGSKSGMKQSEFQEIAARNASAFAFDILAKWKPTHNPNLLFEQLRVHCRDKIIAQHSSIRLLSGQEIKADQLYVDVWLLNRQSRTVMVSQESMLETFDLRSDRLGLGDRIIQSPGFNVANTESKLLILGKPGAGKTSFLKHLAAAWCNGRFHPDLIAVFIELRRIKSKKWKLLNAICDELDIQDQKEVRALLEKGKFLLLMDGIDVTSTEELRQRVKNEIEEIARRYPKNRFILTSRTQVIESIPYDFTVVEVAYFNEYQVEAFVKNWFRGTGQDEVTIAQRWEAFSVAMDRNTALKELTATPVLLALICLVLQDEGEIPAQASLLYERGVRLLLQKWNDSKAVDEWGIGAAVYRQLTVEQKEHLLMQIAANKFEDPNNFVLFEESDLARQIVEHLELTNRSDGRAILKSIEAQHGLLIERADELWSFSHLTFQEHFATKWLLGLSITELSQKITDEKWQKIIRQLVTSQGQSDRFLKLIKQSIDLDIARNHKVQEFLGWVFTKSQSVKLTYRHSSIRAFYFDLSLSLILSSEYGVGLAYNTAIHAEFSLARHLNPDLELDFNHVRINDLGFDYFLCSALNVITGVAIGIVDEIYTSHQIDNDFKERFQILLNELPEEEDLMEEWIVDNEIEWMEELRSIIITHRNIGHYWEFSEIQLNLLQKYYDANEFLVELLKIGNSVSTEARQEIEENLLLPIDEL
jgi:nucleoside phosphorylase